jgi:hypothetical protein
MASGHYKSITIAAQQGNTISAETIVTLLNISITTANTFKSVATLCTNHAG